MIYCWKPDVITKTVLLTVQRLPNNRFYWTHTRHNRPETQVNRAYSQNISVVKTGSFMWNKGHVFVCICVRTFMDSNNILTSYHIFILTTYHIFAPKIRRPIFFNFPGRGQPLFSNFHSMGPPIIKKRCCRPGGGGTRTFLEQPWLKSDFLLRKALAFCPEQYTLKGINALHDCLESCFLGDKVSVNGCRFNFIAMSSL